MSHEMRYDPETGIVEVTGSGPIGRAEVAAIMVEVLELLRLHRSRLMLNDFRDAHLTLSVADLAHLPGEIARAGRERSVDVLRVKRATIIGPKNFEDPRDPEYLEAVMDTYGHQQRVFADIDEARAWLLAK